MLTSVGPGLAVESDLDILGISKGRCPVIIKVQRWGNSQGVRLSKALLADAEIAVGDEVEISVRGREVVISPVRQVRGRHELSDLVRRLPDPVDDQDLDWGPPVGREVW